MNSRLRGLAATKSAGTGPSGCADWPVAFHAYVWWGGLRPAQAGLVAARHSGANLFARVCRAISIAGPTRIGEYQRGDSAWGS